MIRNIFALLTVVVLMSRYGWSATEDEPVEMLSKAANLYYEAKYTQSIDLLRHADELLQKQEGHLQEKISVKLQLGLGYMGLDDNDQAKSYFIAVYALNPDFQLDPQQYPPKAVSFIEGIKIEQIEQN